MGYPCNSRLQHKAQLNLFPMIYILSFMSFPSVFRNPKACPSCDLKTTQYLWYLVPHRPMYGLIGGPTSKRMKLKGLSKKC